MNSKIIEGEKALHSEMKEWMDHIHQYPELALQETETAKYLAGKLGYGRIRDAI
jgi:hippurate hydrolase